MEQVRKWLPYVAVILVNFYLLPLLIGDTGSAIFLLMIVMPAICLSGGVLYGVFHSFHIAYPIMVMLLFLPTIWIYYNDSAMGYLAYYGIAALLGTLLGFGIARLVNRDR